MWVTYQFYRAIGYVTAFEDSSDLSELEILEWSMPERPNESIWIIPGTMQ